MALLFIEMIFKSGHQIPKQQVLYDFISSFRLLPVVTHFQ